MRPIRISLQNRSYEDFSEDLLKCYASSIIADEDHLRNFYEQMVKQYRSIILDLDTSALLMGLTYSSGWMLCEYFVRNTPTPDTLESFLEKQAQESSSGFDEQENSVQHTSTQPKTFHPNEELFNRIIERVGENGADSLTKGEKEYLNMVAKFYRDNGNK